MLNVEYGEVKSGEEAPGMTGGICRYNRLIVEPCLRCIKKETGPARQLVAAIKKMGVGN